MPTIASVQVPPPRSWDTFEDITLSAAKIRWNSSEFFRNGRLGQKQKGVDIWGNDKHKTHVGIQCKNTVDSISLYVIDREISNAEAFLPILDHLYVATTAKRDAILQQAVREISRSRSEVGKFKVDVLFWDDIVQDIATKAEVFFAHYPQFKSEQASQATMFMLSDNAQAHVQRLSSVGDAQNIANVSGSAKLFMSDSSFVGANAPPVVLPPPDAGFSALSNSQLRNLIDETSSRLRLFQTDIDVLEEFLEKEELSSSNKYSNPHERMLNRHRIQLQIIENNDYRFNEEFLPIVKQLVGEFIKRTGPIQLETPNVASGMEAYKKSRSVRGGLESLRSGKTLNRPARVADFLDVLAERVSEDR